MVMPTMLHAYPVHLNFEQPQPGALVELKQAPGAVLAANQPYHVYVKLVVPDTPRNQDLGMFMIRLTLATGVENK